MNDTTFSLAGASVYLACPDTSTQAWVLGLHGSGRDALSYRDIPFYIRQRDLALENGCAFASISLDKNIWARDEGFEKLLLLHSHMCFQGYRPRCVPMASSAGGCQMFRFAEEYPQYVAALVGIFPVWDVEKIRLPSLEAAWGLSGDALARALEKNNPARHVSALSRIPIVLCHGLNDTAVPIEDHALALARQIPLHLHTTEDGHSTQAFSLYDTPLIAHILRRYALQEE